MAGKNAEKGDAPAGGLFDAATSFDGLWRGWEKVQANDGAAGGDGVTCARFAAQARNTVSRLSHALRTGLYRPAPSRRVLIAKPAGGTRPLDIPSVIDRVAQASVALVIGPRLDAEMEDASFAYRPGRSVAQAIARVAALRRRGFTHVVDGDITRYFERVPHDRLLMRLDDLLNDPRLVDLIAGWLEHHAWDGRGLPQGSPLSPLLANLYLDNIDEAIESAGVRLVRFADDFILLCKSADKAEGALTRMGELLRQHGLELHPDKTRVVSFDQGFRFLGHVLVRSMIFKDVTDDDTPGEAALTANALAALPAPDLDAGPGDGRAADEDQDGQPAAGRWAARRRVLYLLEPGRRLTGTGDHFQVHAAEELVLDLPGRRVDRIEIGPGVGIEVSALDLASAQGTEIARVDGRGATLGRWVTAAPGRVERHLAQAAAVLAPDRRAQLAAGFVAGRIFNQRVLLKRLDRARMLPDHAAVAARLARLVRLVERQPMAVAELMGHEGEAAALYWPMLATLAGPDWAVDGRRKRRVGADRLNILLDLFSSMLIRDCRAALDRAGLHSGYAFLHSAENGEEALAYDLAEEFRAPLAEACAMAAIARKTLRASSFTEGANGLRLTRDGWAAAIRAFEGWVQRPIRDPESGDSTLWRGLIDRQAERLAGAIESGGAYHSYRMDY